MIWAKRKARARQLRRYRFGGYGPFSPWAGWLSNGHWLVRCQDAKGLDGTGRSFAGVPPLPLTEEEWRAFFAPLERATVTPLKRLGEVPECGVSVAYEATDGHISAIDARYEPLLDGFSVVRLNQVAHGTEWWADMDVESHFPIAGATRAGGLAVVIQPVVLVRP